MNGTHDAHALRRAFGAFLTGVTVIATREADGTPRGFTANSFTSVSLDPPLLLVCIAKSAASCDVFLSAGAFSVNILSEHQQDISNLFASKRPDKFNVVEWRAGATGSPLIEGVSARFDCRTEQVVEAGDHYVLVGRIENHAVGTDRPLGYAQGGYFRVALERQAADALSEPGRAVVGAILDCGGKLLLVRRPGDSALCLPEVGRTGAPGTASRLRAMMRERGADISLDFVFAVFEDRTTPVQYVYYHGAVRLMRDAADVSLYAPAGIPWDEIPDANTLAMIRRYLKERDLGTFGVYVDEGSGGEVRILA